MDTKLAHKAVKSARLAASEETLLNEDAARTTGRTAGELAAKAGLTLAQLDSESGCLSRYAVAWDSAVDGWYDAKATMDVTADEVGELMTAIPADARNVVTRMWAELQRRRGL